MYGASDDGCQSCTRLVCKSMMSAVIGATSTPSLYLTDTANDAPSSFNSEEDRSGSQSSTWAKSTRYRFGYLVVKVPMQRKRTGVGGIRPNLFLA